MIKNYFKIAFRNLVKNKLYSVINILGLTIGMVCTILLFLYVSDELSYDEHHPYAERTYRVTSELNMRGQHYNLAVAPAPLGKTFLTEFPEVEKFARFRSHGSQIINYGKKSFKETKVIFADNSVLEIFNIDLIKGNKQKALSEPNTIILNKTIAKKYFGKEDPLGKILLLDNNYSYKVTGIFDEIPSNTHFDYDIIMSMESLEESREEVWLSNNFNTYIVLSENADPFKLEKKFPEFIKKYFSAQIEQVMGIPFDQLDTNQINASFYLQPLTDIHLHSDLEVELGVNGDIQYVIIFSIIAVFILLIAAVNFINISTARSAKRAKEVGIRKVLGSQKQELISQFLTESFLITLISVLIALGGVKLLIPFFNELTGKSLVLNLLDNLVIVPLLLIIILIVGLLAGSYPAFVLSSYRPVLVLSGKQKNAAKTGNFRSALVVFQFTIAITLIISTIIVYNQLDYIQNKKLGYDKEHVVILKDAFLLGNKLQTMKKEMLAYPEVENATISSYLPVPSDYNNSSIYPLGKQSEMVSVMQWGVDYDYIETMKIKLKYGRKFSEEYGNEEDNVIINEATVKQFGLSNPIGTKFVRFINNDGDTKVMTVVGVVENFHFESLRKNISPLIMYIKESNGLISFRVNTANMSSFVSILKNKWTELAPNQPFNYDFLDEAFSNIYFAEEKVGSVFAIFAGLAIFTACLGLFSLSAFFAEEKTKEVGIRKVLGSSVSQIVLLLSKEFIKPILIAFIIAMPIAYIAIKSWLQDFAYRIDIEWWMFAFAGLFAVGIAILTMSFQTIKAAKANPVESLKYE